MQRYVDPFHVDGIGIVEFVLEHGFAQGVAPGGGEGGRYRAKELLLVFYHQRPDLGQQPAHVGQLACRCLQRDLSGWRQ